MCFSYEASVFFAVLAGVVGTMLHLRGHSWRRVQLFYYFMLMEALQAGTLMVNRNVSLAMGASRASTLWSDPTDYYSLLLAGGYLVIDDCDHWFNKVMTVGALGARPVAAGHPARIPLGGLVWWLQGGGAHTCTPQTAAGRGAERSTCLMQSRQRRLHPADPGLHGGGYRSPLGRG